jgi:hypothetical protein
MASRPGSGFLVCWLLSVAFVAHSGDVTPARPIHYPRPLYPETAWQKKLEARIVLQGVVTKSGTYTEVEVLSCDVAEVDRAPSEELQEHCAVFENAARSAVAEWVYEPPTQDGNPVDMQVRNILEFDYWSTAGAGLPGATKTRFSRAARKGLEPAPRPGYGLSADDPVRVGGGYDDGRWNRTMYLLSLRGPDGEEVTFSRLGPGRVYENSATPTGHAVIDLFEVNHAGLAAPITVYIDFNKYERPWIPAGFTFEWTPHDDWQQMMHSNE